MNGFFRFSWLGCLIVSAAVAQDVKTQLPDVLPTKTTWIGNTFGEGNRQTGKWVQNQMFAIAVAPDGKVFANSVWDEGGREIGVYKDGQVIGKMADTHDVLGGYSIAIDEKYVFAGMKSGFVRRYLHSGAPAPFDGGERDKSWLRVTEDQTGPAGLAVQGGELFVADNAGGEIKVYDVETMQLVRKFDCPAAGTMVASKDALWVIRAPSPRVGERVMKYSFDGTKQPHEITDVTRPSALAIDSQGRLLVADNGPAQQIVIYDVEADPKRVGTFGETGGVFAGEVRGRMGPDRFYGITGVAFDSEGNLYVSCNGFNWCVSDLRVFDPQGNLKWQLQSLHFVDTADADPIDDTSVFSMQERYEIDYNAAKLGKGWKHAAYTLDPFRYPEDPRLSRKPNSVRVVRIEGKRFLYTTDMPGTAIIVFRFDGEIMVPCVMLQRESEGGLPPNSPPEARWLWRDLNADGAFQSEEYEVHSNKRDRVSGMVDSSGDIWESTWDGKISRMRCKGLDGNGIAIYSEDAVEIVDRPPGWKSLDRVEYDVDSDTLYCGGYTDEHPRNDNQFAPLGRVIGAYPNWSKGNREPAWRTPIPYSTKPHMVAKSMAVAGEYVFVAYMSSIEQVVVIERSGGKVVGRFVPGPEINNTAGDADVLYAINAIKRSNGEYIVFHEDDRYAKIVLYRWTPPATAEAISP